MKFIDENFECSNRKFDDDDVNDINDLLNTIETRSGSIHQLVLLFIGLLRGLDVTTRYVRTIDPRGLKPSDHLDIVERVYREANQEKPQDKKQRKEVIVLDDIVDIDNVIDNSTYKYKKKCTSLAQISFSAWIEICIPVDNFNSNSSSSTTSNFKVVVDNQKHNVEIIDLVDDDDDEDEIDYGKLRSNISNNIKSMRWINVDLYTMTLDDSSIVEASRPNKRPVVYVIGCENNQRAKDLTKRYAQQYSITKGVRLQDFTPGYFSISTAIASTTPRHLSNDEILRNDNEEFELMERITTNAPTPTTVNGFKNHPLYILKKDVKKSQILKPKAKVCGMVKGQAYYNRSDIADLNTKSSWGKLMRQIKDGETPIKTETKSVKGKEIISELYGEWQTQPLVVQAVVNGVIPVNKYGNVEVWKYNFSLVPKGATFLTTEEAPSAQAVAQELGVPYAKAIVDFEIRKGNSFPKYGGLVVLNEHAHLIRESSRNIENHNIEQAKQKHEKAVLKRWEHLVREKLKRNKLKEKYGH